MTGNWIFLELAVALAAGMLIGFEREQSNTLRSEPMKGFLGGARTYPMVALGGAVASLIAQKLGGFVFAIALLGLLAPLAISFAQDVKAGSRGVTSEIALMFTFLIGALVVTPVIEPPQQRVLVVLSLAVVASLLLSVKAPLHKFIQQLSPQDLYATLKFLIVAVVVLPLLPNRTFGPLDVLNPRTIGWMVVLIAGISFVGYIAIRLMGPRRGLGVTGLLGGLASSTAVTLTMSQRGKQAPSLSDSCALAVVLASSIMFLRMAVLVAVVNAALLKSLWIPLTAMTLGGAIAVAILWRRARRSKPAEGDEVEFRNPFELGTALKFAALYAVVLLGTKAATTYFGAGVTYLAAVLAGTTHVDPITLTMAGLSKETLSPQVADTAILLAAISNTVVKGGMALVVGTWKFAWRVAAAFALMIAMGLLSLVAVWMM